jgi:hypothetical protein
MEIRLLEPPSRDEITLSLFLISRCSSLFRCMNNLTFGDKTFGYYETIGGGCGAGPSWDGTSGVQTHMTNTRITDPEIFERRYPVSRFCDTILWVSSLDSVTRGLGS